MTTWWLLLLFTSVSIAEPIQLWASWNLHLPMLYPPKIIAGTARRLSGTPVLSIMVLLTQVLVSNLPWPLKALGLHRFYRDHYFSLQGFYNYVHCKRTEESQLNFDPKLYFQVRKWVHFSCAAEYCCCITMKSHYNTFTQLISVEQLHKKLGSVMQFG